MPRFTIYLVLSCLSFLGCNDAKNDQHKPLTEIEKRLARTEQWFKAWELVSSEMHIKDFKTTDFIFFDDSLVYATTAITIPDGEQIQGPGVLGKQLLWKVKAHQGNLLLPDSNTVPIGIMSFASKTKEGKRFFVMPLPSFWDNAQVKTTKIGLPHLVTGVFLHEFSHSQIADLVNDSLNAYEKMLPDSISFSDNIIQDLFSNNPSYVKLFKEENKLLYDAALTTDSTMRYNLCKKGLVLLKQRHAQYLGGNTQDFLRKSDQLFLTMEGLGQYTMLLWLTHAKGAAYNTTDALAGVRRGGSQWSQEEGLALALLTEQYYGKHHFGKLFFEKANNNFIDLLLKK